MAFDYGTAMDIVLVIGQITSLGSLVADILYAFIDPRICFN